MNNYFVSDILHYCNVSLTSSDGIPQTTIDFYDFTFVLNGSMTYIIGKNTYVLKKNDAICLKPGTVRSRVPITEPVKFVSFNFQLLPGKELPFPEYLPNCIPANIKNLVSVFPQSHILPYYHSKEKIANMLNYILLELLDVVALQLNNENVNRIFRYIDSHITEKMSLQSISREVGLSKEYTANLFKKETNRTLTDYINERKMLLAKELILQNVMSLTELSIYLGYSDYSYFSKLFKRYFDVTPIGMRNRHR